MSFDETHFQCWLQEQPINYGDDMNNPDHNPDVCDKDSYGNVTAHEQNGNDIRNETGHKGYTIDVGIMAVVWNPYGVWFGKFSNLVAAKSAIDAAIALSK